jgi:hypothetical protein
MHNGLPLQVSLVLGCTSSLRTYLGLMTSSLASKMGWGHLASTAGTNGQSPKASILQQQQTGVGQVRLSLFNPHNDVGQQEKQMSTNIFADLASLAASDVFPPVLTLVNSTLQDIETNPQEWVNPASATVKGTAFVANLIATLPAIENTAVPAAAQLVSAVLSTLSAKLTSVSGTVTPASVGAEIGNTIISKT